MILERTSFTYSSTYEAIKSFAEYYIEPYKNKTSAKRNCYKELTNIFFDTDLSCITKESLASIIDNNPVTVITTRFLIYICENGYVEEENSLMILMNYKTLFTKICPKDRFMFFLSLDNDLLNKFAALHPIFGEFESSVILSNIENVSFIDNDLKTALSAYINSLKLDTSSTSINSLQHRIIEVTHICEYFLSKYKKEEISREIIAAALSMGWIRVETMIEMNKILLYLLDESIIVSEELRRVVELKESTPPLSLDKYRELLLSDNIRGYFIRDNTHKRLLYANVNNKELLEALKGYAKQSTESGIEFVTFLNEFGNSIDNLNINSLNDLNLSSYIHQVNYYKVLNRKCISFVTGFYAYVVNNLNPDILNGDGLSGRLFQKNALGFLIADGYEIVKYNPVEDVPASDKWVFCYSSNDETNSMFNTSNSRDIDFTVIQNKTYREWYKHYIWKNSTSLYSKFHTASQMTEFFNYIDNLKNGRELSIYAKETKDINITINEIIAYKNYVMNTYTNNRTRASHIYTPRIVLKFLHDDGLVNIPNGVFYYLTHKLDSNYDNTKAIPDEHLKRISELMKKNAEDSVKHAVLYLAFYIALETEFRSSQLFTLKCDCVVETAKKGEFVLVSKTKTSANEEIEQPITIYVKKHIDEILKLTKDYRENCIVDDISTYLFIAAGEKKGTYVVLTTSMFNNYLSECCNDLGIPKYTYNNLRDTHMTKAEEYIIRNQMSDMEQCILSGHRSPNTDTKHYIDTQIKDLLESVHGVIIGNVNISGQIKESLPDDIAKKENAVSNNCGYCGCKSCNDFSFLSCMLCKDFVTTVDRLPYFKEQVRILDEKIKNATVPHDKEDLVNIKRLHLGYISKILELKSKKGR